MDAIEKTCKFPPTAATPHFISTGTANDQKRPCNLESFKAYLYTQHHNPSHIAPNAALDTSCHFINYHMDQGKPQSYLQYPPMSTNDQGQPPWPSAGLDQVHHYYNPSILPAPLQTPASFGYLISQSANLQKPELPTVASSSRCAREASPECSLRVIIEDPTNPKPYREKRKQSDEERTRRKEDAQLLKALGGACLSCRQHKKKCGFGDPCPLCIRTGKMCIRRSPNRGYCSDSTPPFTPLWHEGNGTLLHSSSKGKMRQREISPSSPRYQLPFGDSGDSSSKPGLIDYRDGSVSPVPWSLTGLYDKEEDDMEMRLFWALLRSNQPSIV